MLGLYLAEGHCSIDGDHHRHRLCWSFHPRDEEHRAHNERVLRAHATALVCLMVVSGLPSCGGTEDVAHECPPPVDVAAIHLGCRSSEQPLVKTTGPCAQNDPISDPKGYVYLRAVDAGMCHVDLTFVSGATSS